MISCYHDQSLLLVLEIEIVCHHYGFVKVQHLLNICAGIVCMAGLVYPATLHHHEETFPGVLHHKIYGSFSYVSQGHFPLFPVYCIGEIMVAVRVLLKQQHLVGTGGFRLVVIVSAGYCIAGFFSLHVIAFIAVVRSIW